MYINSNYGGTDTSDITVMENLILNIEPLLWEYRVNIGFYGHNHAVRLCLCTASRALVRLGYRAWCVVSNMHVIL